MRLRADDSERALSDHGRHSHEGCAGCLSPSRRLHTPERYELGKREGPGFRRPGPFARGRLDGYASRGIWKSRLLGDDNRGAGSDR